MPSLIYEKLRWLAHSFLRKLGRLGTDYFRPFQDVGNRFDGSIWQSLSAISESEVATIIETCSRNLQDSRTILTTGGSMEEDVARCKRETGVWPISFSFPHSGYYNFSLNRQRQLSNVRPGSRYTFISQDAYYKEYQESEFAITHRKGGWDCFRHVEILACGTIPLMPDIDNVPQYSMVHYPKDIMRIALSEALSGNSVRSPDLLEQLNNHFSTHLTCESMAEYVLKTANMSGSENILFIDNQLRHVPDYLSVLTLIGLKQKLGRNVTTLKGPTYIYDGWRGKSSQLSGLGFAYARSIPEQKRREVSQLRFKRDLKKYDTVVVGSISRNGPLAFRLLEHFPSSQTIWLHGEDAAPSPREMHFLIQSKTNVFVRSLP